jgi:beta-glucosidase
MCALQRRRAIAVLIGAASMSVATTLGTGAAVASPAEQGRPVAQSALPDLVGQLITGMTLDEKLTFVNGWPDRVSPPPTTDRAIGVGFIPGVPRLGIPALTFTDGPAGVRVNEPTTAMPAPIALASTFSSDLARRYGQVLGRDSRSTDQDVIFGPMLNLVRVPQAGRNFETLGEDPALMSLLVAAETQGIQSEGVIATAKHYAANNQEVQRQTINVNVDERTLHETELRGFEAAVKAGGTGSVMCSYNLVNGLHACENPTLLTEILRKQWGFKGFVVSDYGATQSAGPALQAGLDIEFFTNRFSGLKAGIESGSVPEAALDDAVRHILVPMQEFGLLAHASPNGGTVVNRPIPPIQTGKNAPEAREIAEQGAVLLKNNAKTLPLRKADLASLAVIGPSARQLLTGGGGSSRVVGNTERQISPLEALRQRAGGGDISFAVGRDLQGTTVPSAALTPPSGSSGGHGLLRTNAATGASQVDPTLDFVGSGALPEGTRGTWSGTITAPTPGEYLLAVQTGGTSASMIIDGAPVQLGGVFAEFGDNLHRTTDDLFNRAGRVQLTAGEHTIAVTASPTAALPPFIPADSGPAQIRLAWVTPEQRQANVDAAVATARAARTAVVFANTEGTEGADQPSLNLSDRQNELIQAVAEANPRTVVVLNSGYPTLMPWLDEVKAVLTMWYPGQEGGWATADLLVGKAVPAGKLPVTFPAREADAPTASPERYPGVNGQQYYSEGILMGYRWYDAKGITPLFEFGYGQSYTTFRYSHLKVLPGRHGTPARVRFTIKNTGSHTGTEIAQVYVGRLPVAVETPPKQLAGVGRVTLRPGQSRRVTVDIDPLSVSTWDSASDRWEMATGAVPVLVGSSSRDIPLRDTLRL